MPSNTSQKKPVLCMAKQCQTAVKRAKVIHEEDRTSHLSSLQDSRNMQGFGPFRQHLVNSSWEAAKELLKLSLGNDVDLHIIELPVAYQKAKEMVCKAWATLNPKLMIHLGLASISKGSIILEQCGKNKGYKDMDVCRFCPEGNSCLLEGPEKIESIINMKRVWKNLQVEGVDVIFSRDAGRYLCDYVYYTSLYYGNGRAAFIHVPPLTKLVTAEFLGNVLQTIILAMLTQCKAENM